ncbi:hypothetical protein ACOMHN_008209 [Nucella lapillus]
MNATMNGKFEHVEKAIMDRKEQCSTLQSDVKRLVDESGYFLLASVRTFPAGWLQSGHSLLAGFSQDISCWLQSGHFLLASVRTFPAGWLQSGHSLLAGFSQDISAGWLQSGHFLLVQSRHFLLASVRTFPAGFSQDGSCPPIAIIMVIIPTPPPFTAAAVASHILSPALLAT